MFVYEECIECGRSIEEDYVNLFSRPSDSASDNNFSMCQGYTDAFEMR